MIALALWIASAAFLLWLAWKAIEIGFWLVLVFKSRAK